MLVNGLSAEQVRFLDEALTDVGDDPRRDAAARRLAVALRSDSVKCSERDIDTLLATGRPLKQGELRDDRRSAQLIDLPISLKSGLRRLGRL